MTRPITITEFLLKATEDQIRILTDHPHDCDDEFSNEEQGQE